MSSLSPNFARTAGYLCKNYKKEEHATLIVNKENMKYAKKNIYDYKTT